MNGLKCSIPVFFYVKSALIPPMLDASMILEQDLLKKNWILGLDGSGMEVDDEIVCRGSRWLFHLMKHFLDN